MKTLVEKWTHPKDYSFHIKQYPLSNKGGQSNELIMRTHKEHELTIINGGKGKRFIGNTIENFSDGDMFLIGPHVPHAVQLDPNETGQVVTIHFLGNAFGQGFFDVPENKYISRLLQDALLGVTIEELDIDFFFQKAERLSDVQPFERMISFLKLLHQMALMDRKILSSRGFTPIINEKDYEIVNKTYDYIINRFSHEKITLDEISTHVSMAPATFCRYFKKHFQKTFTQFLNEVRIGHACKLLQETNKNISEIGFASGYSQLTHFNRQFKRLTGYSPKGYRQQLD